MTRISYGTHVFMYPMPVTLLGVNVGNKPNFMALGWISRVNADPPLVGCGVAKNHYTNRGIRENNSFSINIPTVSMLKITDYCGLVSGKLFDKSELFEVFYGDLGSAPMIAGCPLSMECRLTQTVENPSNNFYIGEIVSSYTEEKYLTDGHPDIKKINPLLLTMPDNRYWTVGEFAGNAWKAGMALKNQSGR
ncbi:MAG TPA: flavin reductase family protein [Methanoregulaceae archaeon]|nr:flavin reductase family protein [Methanoregulaceae archaeon]